MFILYHLMPNLEGKTSAEHILKVTFTPGLNILSVES